MEQLILVARRAMKDEKLYAVKYYDCQLEKEVVSTAIIFEDEKLAKEYGQQHFEYENTGYTDFVDVVQIKVGDI